MLRTEIQSLGEIIEKGESKSISYHADRGHAGEFFLEVLPRKHHLVLLLDADFDELRELSPRVADATEQKFFVYAKYSGGTSLQFTGEAELQDTMACVRRAFELARA